MYSRVEVGVIRDIRKTLGFTRQEVNAAKKELGVITENCGDGRWFWSLP